MCSHGYITSMFRSGSTLVARMLNAHGEIACASDPMRQMFNSFRYDLLGPSFQARHARFDPLGDYFFSGAGQLHTVLESSFDVPIQADMGELLQTVVDRAVMFSGSWAEAIDLDRRAATYAELVSYFMDQILRVYGKGDGTGAVAFKEVWSSEFFPALKRQYPGMKCIAIVRDPRAVVASRVATGQSYPHLFMGRQWRKLACLNAFLKHVYQDDVMLVRYEDFVTAPREHIGEMCALLDVTFDEGLLDVSTYTDGWGKPWKRNSNLPGTSAGGIKPDGIDRWKDILSEEDVRSIEFFAWDWMDFYGYERSNDDARLRDMCDKDYVSVPEERLADWIRPYSFDADPDRLAAELLLERMRFRYAGNGSQDDCRALQFKWW